MLKREQLHLNLKAGKKETITIMLTLLIMNFDPPQNEQKMTLPMGEM